MKIPDEFIFCSSLEGSPIPSGINFIDYINEEIQKPEVVVLLLTEAYYTREFCLCELGAAWALCHNIIPIVVPPLLKSNVQGVLGAIQLREITSSADLDHICSELRNYLDIDDFNLAKYNVKRDVFLEKIPSLIAKQPKRTQYSTQEYDDLDNRYSEAVKEVVKSNEEATKLKQQILEISKLKDKEDVSKILLEGSDEQAKFEELVNRIVEQANSLDGTGQTVMKVLLSEYYGHNSSYHFSQTHDDREDFTDAAERCYIQEIDNGWYVATKDNRKVKRLSIAVADLIDFMEDEASVDFIEAFENENDVDFDFISKSFWEFIL